jgi:hypothetical protein
MFIILLYSIVFNYKNDCVFYNLNVSLTVLQDVTDELIEIGRCYGMEMNVEKTKVMRI